MFDPNFNPFEDLQKMVKNLELLNKNMIEISRAINHHGEVIQDIHQRLRLLEIARQYDQKNNNQQ